MYTAQLNYAQNLDLKPLYGALQSPTQTVEDDPDSSLDLFIHLRPKILKSKLEVLASEIRGRLSIRERNLDRIDSDRENLSSLIGEISKMAGYGVRQHSEKDRLYQKMFDLESERRDQDVSCWKDVVDVMRDFLTTWEAHEQTKARAMLLNDD